MENINVQVLGHDTEHCIVQASLSGFQSQSVEMTAFRHHTRSGHYVHVISSTQQPTVDAYMVITVRCSTYIPTVYYMVK